MHAVAYEAECASVQCLLYGVAVDLSYTITGDGDVVVLGEVIYTTKTPLSRLCRIVLRRAISGQLLAALYVRLFLSLPTPPVHVISWTAVFSGAHGPGIMKWRLYVVEAILMPPKTLPSHIIKTVKSVKSTVLYFGVK